MPTTDPALNERFQRALLDPQARLVCVGPKPRWARPIVRALWSTALYGIIFVGVFTTGSKIGEISGLAGELSARAAPMQVLEQKPQRVRWLDMPTSPFLEVARTEAGAYSINRLIGAYKAAGMTEQQGRQVAARLRDLSPVLMGAKDDALAAQFRQQAFTTASELQRDFPVFHRRLAKMLENHVTHTSYRRAQWDNPENWSSVRFDTWAAEGVLPSGSAEKGALERVSFIQARAAAEEAVQQTGLRALRIHPSNWSPSCLYDLSLGLIDAQGDLQDATGLQGQVVGMGGRVVLMMGSPPAEEQAAGITKAARTGAVFVNAEWSNLAHEWFHVLDFVAAQHVLSMPGVDSLSAQMQPLRFTENRQVFNAWKKAIAAVDRTSPHWQQEREKRLNEEMQAREARAENQRVQPGAITSPDWNTRYWVSPEEVMAYAFQAFVSDQHPIVLEGRIAGAETFRMPSPAEVKRQAAVWKGLFTAVESLGLTDPMEEIAEPDAQPPARRAQPLR